MTVPPSTGVELTHRPVVVVDLGGQYAQLIARRVRELGVFSKVVAHSVAAGDVAAMHPLAIVLSGGPASVYEPGAPEVDRALFDLGVPVLGICYGMQLMARDLGGRVERTGVAEFGRTRLVLEEAATSALLAGSHEMTSLDCWMSHRDAVVEAPAGAAIVASTAHTPIAAFEHRERALYGVQFHPEVVHTDQGMEMIAGFLFDVAHATADWTPAQVIEEQVAAIRARVGAGRVLCALSGGVDSAVAAALVHRAVGDRLTCVYVDHGLMRKGESTQVVATFREHLNIELVHVNEAARFLACLAGVEDPERKRRIIGEQFIRVFEREARAIGERDGHVNFLVQGTLYSDVIESGGDREGVAATIKSHHNVGGLPEEIDLEIVEPLRMLFKDEVRRVGEALGLPREMVWRQPFPGPGLAIRIIGEVTPERVAIVREADAIVLDEVHRAGMYDQLWQTFAVLPAVRSVGVQGDARTYAYPIVLRAVTSDDAMTADWARLPYDLVERISTRIVAEVDQVNRVVLDVTSKPPGTIEWE